MLEGKIDSRRGNLERLRSRVRSQLKLALGPSKEPSENSQKNSQNSTSFQDSYRLGQKIGEGAHAVIKRGFQINTGNVVAVKSLEVDDQRIQSIKQGFLITSRLDHPSIIRHLQLFINRKNQQTFIVMEYCPYPTLHSNYRQITSGSEIVHILKSLLEAVCELHRNGICHRDLKPQNILYERSSGKIKIIDLEIAKLIFNSRRDQKEKMWTSTGTLHYKAPEMFQGSEYDEMVDAWAVGVIAYQLVYSRLPFSSEFEMETIQSITTVEPKFDDPTSPHDSLITSFLQGLLRKNPQNRMNCFQALRHPLLSRSPLAHKKFQSIDLSGSDLFSSRVTRSRSLGRVWGCESNVEGAKDLTIKELRFQKISETDSS